MGREASAGSAMDEIFPHGEQFLPTFSQGARLISRKNIKYFLISIS
jgi:hypothetical protein